MRTKILCRIDIVTQILLHLFLFFFFQAEDGIRDYKVTGVQTCALPIFVGGAFADGIDKRRLLLIVTTGQLACSAALAVNAHLTHPHLWLVYVLGALASGGGRERGGEGKRGDLGGGRIIKKKKKKKDGEN